MNQTANPYAPIAVGFVLLALPLVVAVFLVEDSGGAWTNAIAALVMLGCAALVWRRKA